MQSVTRGTPTPSYGLFDSMTALMRIFRGCCRPQIKHPVSTIGCISRFCSFMESLALVLWPLGPEPRGWEKVSTPHVVYLPIIFWPAKFGACTSKTFGCSWQTSTQTHGRLCAVVKIVETEIGRLPRIVKEFVVVVRRIGLRLCTRFVSSADIVRVMYHCVTY